MPNFDMFTPTPTRPRCTTYVHRVPGLSATTTFAAQDSFLGTTITSLQQQHTTTFTLYNLYSPGRPDPVAAILPTIDLLTDCLLMGNLNAHHTWWQGPLPPSARTSLASHTIANWLTENNFPLHNEIANPTHHPQNGGQPSTIDLCLSRGRTTQLVLTLAIDHDTTSDHRSLTATLSIPSNAAPQKAQHCWRKADWGSFASHIQTARMDLSNLQGTEDTLRAVTNITHLIHEATNHTVPMKDPRRQEAPWWNQNLTLAERAVKRAEK